MKWMLFLLLLLEELFLSGGVGTPFGTIFGVLIKGTISSLITTQGTLSSWWVRIVLSALLCFFIVLQAVFAHFKKEIISRKKLFFTALCDSIRV